MTRNEFLLKLLEMECLRIDKTPSRITANIYNAEEEETLRVNLSLEKGDEDHYSIFKWNQWNRERKWHQVTRGDILKSSYEVLYDYIMLHFEDNVEDNEDSDKELI